MKNKKIKCFKELTEFSKLIKMRRKEKGYTQNELSHLVGVTVSNVKSWEHSNTEPNAKNLVELAKALDIYTVSELLKENRMEDNQLKNYGIEICEELEKLEVGETYKSETFFLRDNKYDRVKNKFYFEIKRNIDDENGKRYVSTLFVNGRTNNVCWASLYQENLIDIWHNIAIYGV